jgi:PAS domain S-box-containing protein
MDTKPDNQALEEKLRESEARYRIISELTSDVAYSFRVEPDGRLVHEWSTDAIVRATGYTIAEIEALGWEHMLHPEDIAVFKKRMQSLFSGKSDVSEFRIITRAGEVCWVRSYGHPVWDGAQGRVVRIYGAVQNITDRRRGMEALQLSEERFRALAEATFEGLVITDANSMLDMNPQFARIFSYETGELIGRAVQELIAPEDQEHVLSRLTAGHNIPYEWSGIRKDGSRIVIEAHSKLFPYKGRMVRVTTVLDITERKRMEEALAESEDRYRSMVSAVTAYTYSVEVRKGRALQTQHSMGCIPVTGYDPGDYAANPYLWHSMIHADDRSMVETMLQELLSGRAVAPLEHRIIKRDGSVVWVRNTMVPHKDADGRLIRYDGLVENISERKHAEEEKERLIAELQKALAKVKTLSGLLPICASCKKIRDDKGYWQQIETYIHDHSEADFSHGICPDCIKKLYPELYKHKKEDNEKI